MKDTITIVAGAFALATLTEPARADDAAITQPYHHAISLQLATLSPAGIAMQGERDLGQLRFVGKASVAVALGGRRAAHGDYSSRTAGAGVELRRWLYTSTPMTGWYVAVRTDLSRTAVEDMVESRDLGALVTWSLGASTGYRFVLFHAVELAPALGAAMIVEGGLDGRSPTTARAAAFIGLTGGWIF